MRLLPALACIAVAAAQVPDPPPEVKTDGIVEPAANSPANSRDDTHILGVVPNYATVNDPFLSKPIRASEKFKLAAQDSFDPFTWVLVGVYAGVAQWGNDYKQFGQGVQGYAKRYGAAFADGAISNYMTEAALPCILHEDPRYFRMAVGSAWKRTGYALTRVLVTRSNAGRPRFNSSEVAGTMIAAGIANLYYPSENRTMGETMEKFTVNVVSDAGFNVLREFWPDMRRKVLRKGDPEPQR
jgi:hypothetical protein